MRRLLCVLLAAFAVLAGCGSDTGEKGAPYQVYFLDLSETKIEAEAYIPTSDTADEKIQELIDAMADVPENRICLLPEGVEIQDFALEEDRLTLNINGAYLDMERSREILARAGLVRAFVQIPEVARVRIVVEGEPLADSRGQEYGYMTADSFVENSGKEINQYQYANLTLYFTNASGDKLVPETRRVPYSTSVPLERVVVEQLIKGPKTEGNFPVLPAAANILSVATSDEITYVNFDKTFTDSVLGVAEEIPIYAVVNSIIANCKVEKVQFSIDGESDVTFREQMELNQFYEENRSLIEELEE